MRRFAPDPETSGAVTTLRVFQHVRWTPQHRAGWRADPLAALSTLALAVGAVFLYVSLLGATALGGYLWLRERSVIEELLGNTWLTLGAVTLSAIVGGVTYYLRTRGRR